jgi:HSP20 family protein
MDLVRRSNAPPSAYRPGVGQDQFGRMIQNVFQDLFTSLAQGAPPRQPGGPATPPRMNVTETEKTFEIEAEMPGVKKDDVKVSIDHDRVTIEAEAIQANERREGEHMLYSDRAVRRFMGHFTLPVEVDEAGAQARLENGILHLTLPKKQDSQPRRLTIQ